MKKLLHFLATGLLLIPGTMGQTVEELSKKSLEAMKNVKSLSYKFYAQERFKGGKFEYAEADIKVQMKPFQVYANAIKPDNAQLIYAGSTPDKVRVKKGPLKLSLSPYSSLLLKQQHHPMYRAGFGTIYKTLSKAMKDREGQDIMKFMKDKGTVIYDGKECYHVELIDPDYRFVNYTVKPGQTTLWQICESLTIPEYKVRMLNDIDYDDIKPGQVIKVPSSYAKKSTLYVDKKTLLPIYQRAEDDLGLYEVYEFKSLKLNPTLTEADFTFK